MYRLMSPPELLEPRSEAIHGAHGLGFALRDGDLQARRCLHPGTRRLCARACTTAELPESAPSILTKRLLRMQKTVAVLGNDIRNSTVSLQTFGLAMLGQLGGLSKSDPGVLGIVSFSLSAFANQRTRHVRCAVRQRPGEGAAAGGRHAEASALR